MVVRYIKVTFVTIFVLVVGLVSTVNINGATGNDNLGISWVSRTNDIGNYQYGYLDTQEQPWTNNFAGYVYNDYDPVLISVYTDIDGEIGNWTLFPNEYLIEHTIINSTQRNITLYIGDVSPEKLLFDITYDLSINGYLGIDFMYYTSGILAEYFAMGKTFAGDSEQSYVDGYKLGKKDGILIGEGQGYNQGWLDAVEQQSPQWRLLGVWDAYHNGFSEYLNAVTQEPYDITKSFSYKHGFNEGIATNNDFSFTGLLTQIFLGVGSVLGIELLPNITLGALVAVPIVFGIIYFILGKRGKD